MPFAQVVETTEVIAVLLEEGFQCLGMQFWTALEVRALAAAGIHGHVHDPKSPLAVQLLA